MSNWNQGGRYRNRGQEEVRADALRRRRQERTRSGLDRTAREWSLEDEEFVVPEGTELKAVPPPATIGSLLAGMVEARGWQERLQGADLGARWAEIVGEPLAARSRPGRLAGGVLQVVVESPQWATQLQYMTDQIAGRVAAVTGRPVREVTVVVARERT